MEADNQGGTATAIVTITVGGEALRLSGMADRVAGMAGNNTFTMDAQNPRAAGLTTTHACSGETISIAGLNRAIDTWDGLGGTDTVNGTASGDALLYDTAFSPDLDSQGTPVGNARLFTSIETISLGAGDDVLSLASGSGGSTSAATAVTVIWGGAGNDDIRGEASSAFARMVWQEWTTGGPPEVSTLFAVALSGGEA